MRAVVTDAAVAAALDVWYGLNHDEPDGPAFKAVLEAAVPYLAVDEPFTVTSHTHDMPAPDPEDG
jgi:hypothetical protein